MSRIQAGGQKDLASKGGINCHTDEATFWAQISHNAVVHWLGNQTPPTSTCYNSVSFNLQYQDPRQVEGK